MDVSNYGTGSKILVMHNNEGTVIVQNGQEHPVPQLLTQPPLLDDDEVIGREEDLKKLREALTATRKVAVVKGVGGVGKTTLARLYVSRHLGEYAHVAWLEQTGGLVEGIASDTNLLRSLHIELPPDTKPEDICREIFARMRELPATSLLVIDNGDSQLETDFFQKCLPQPPTWQVLVTSRQRLGKFKTIPLNVLEPEAARKLFRSFYKKECTDEELDALLEAVGRNTLAVECFSKTLTQCVDVDGPAALLGYLDDHRLDDPAFELNIETAHQRFNGTALLPEEQRLYRYLSRTFDLQNLTDGQTRWLRYFTALPPEFFDKKWLAELLRLDGKAAAEMVNTLEALNGLGWLKKDETGRYAIHRIVQIIGSYRLDLNNETLADLVDGLSIALYFDPTTKDVLGKKMFTLPADTVLKFLNDEHSKTANLKHNLASVSRELGQYEKAKGLLEDALQSHLNNFIPYHTRVANTRHNLGNVYRDLGQYEKAREFLEEALKSYLMNFDSDNTRVATCKSDLANLYKDLGKYESARELLEEALKSDLKNFDSGHPIISTRKSNLGNLYRCLGQYEIARDLLEDALQSDLINFGPNNIKVATRKSNLGIVYFDLEQNEKARNLLEDALQSDLINFGPNNINVAIVRYNLGNVLRALKKYREAMAEFKQALSIFEMQLGGKHPNVEINYSAMIATIKEGAAAGDKEMQALLEKIKKQGGGSSGT